MNQTHQYTDSRGVKYQSSREGQPTVDIKGNRVDGFTVRRLSPRPVDIKRAERLNRKSK